MYTTQLKSQTYQFRNWLGCTRTIYLTVEPSENHPGVFNVMANTAHLDGSVDHSRMYRQLAPLEDTPLQECWENCLEDFDYYFGGKNA